MEGLRIRIPIHTSNHNCPVLQGDMTHKNRTARRVRFKTTPKFYSPIYVHENRGLQKLDEHLVRTEVLKNCMS